MAELLFIATTVFVAYVLFEVVGGKKDTSETSQPVTEPDSNPSPVDSPEKVAPSAEAVEIETSEPVKPVSKEPPAKTSAATTAKTTKTSPAKPKKAAAKKATVATASDSVKNPKTGETAKIPSNYAFAKRWIKDALVEEGLLEKVYKNNELDPETTTKIHQAIEQLKAMKKYQ